MFPDWHLFEPRIRAMAGLGVLDPEAENAGPADQVNAACDVLVVGAGPAGLAAALGAAHAGRSVILCDDGIEPGGSLLHRACRIDGMEGFAWARATVEQLRALGVTLLRRTTAFGVYDHGLVALNERQAGNRPDRLWRLRPAHVVLATGAIERPLPFANNDLPGIMSAEAGLAYLRRFGIAPGRNVIVATNNSHSSEVAVALARHGVTVTLVDSRRHLVGNLDGGDVRAGAEIAAARGRGKVEAVTLGDGSVIEADAVLVSGGFTPTLHLHCQAGGKLRWSDDLLAFVPGDPVAGITVAGAAAGQFDLAALMDGVRKALAPADIAVGRLPQIDEAGRPAFAIAAAWPKPAAKGRVWIDLQNDVTARDIELAARENFVSVEHLKRYTTLGMATDQGKTSNVNGLALMAAITGRSIPEVGTTTYRPPFTPVPLSSFAGTRSGVLMNPLRRLPLENAHRAEGAHFLDYGGWLRPAWYGPGPQGEAVAREARAARAQAALFDGSPLGKIEVMGPQAAAFLDFVFYNTVSTLRPGRARYGLILAENGVVYDDGVLLRLEENRFVVSCSSAHVRGVHAILEEWRQDRFDRGRVFIHDATTQSATITVSGPASRALLADTGFELPLDDATLPHMSTASGRFEGHPVRVTRVSFTGDRSYEISVRADRARPLWERLKRSGGPLGAVPIGMEALLLLRAEKGYVVIGKDTDGMTLPMDLGATAPLQKKTIEFIGRRSLITEDASRADRRQLVGLEVEAGAAPLETGAHGVETGPGGPRSLGYVTSSYVSPTLGRPIALGLIERGASRHGETIEIQHLGRLRRARIAPPCAFDPAGDRLHG
jgi:sarcosine oxidase subunit alpha